MGHRSNKWVGTYCKIKPPYYIDIYKFRSLQAISSEGNTKIGTNGGYLGFPWFTYVQFTVASSRIPSHRFLCACIAYTSIPKSRYSTNVYVKPAAEQHQDTKEKVPVCMYSLQQSCTRILKSSFLHACRVYLVSQQNIFVNFIYLHLLLIQLGYNKQIESWEYNGAG